MRTTLTLDPDVAAKARKAAATRNKSFKEVVNEALRVGLDETSKRRTPRPYRTKPSAIGLRTDLNFDNIGDLIALLEGENHK